MTIYANLNNWGYYGVTQPVTVISKKGVWFLCKFPNGKIKNIHREYMTTDEKDFGALDRMKEA